MSETAPSETAPSETAPSETAPSETAPSRPAPERAALVDLLGVLAYGALTGFDRLAEDARLAPTIQGRAELAELAGVEIGHYRRLIDRLEGLGADPNEAMAPFVGPLDGFHAQTRPSDWLEGLVKAYVGDGMASDFYREIAVYVDEPTRALVIEVLADAQASAFVVREVRAAIAAQPILAGRLSLWGRRLVGEAIRQAQYVAADRDALTELIVGGGGDLNSIMELINRITDRHSERMRTLGLST